MSDDGAITLRIVKQIKAGNGPVFNAGERVEAATSALWLWALTLIDAITPFRLEWVAVLLGIGFTLVGLCFATLGAARLWKGRSGTNMVPLGIVLFTLLPVAWDYATSAMEGGLVVAWLGAAFWMMVTAGSTPPSRRSLVCAVLVGLGPLVRPDLGLYSLGLVALLVAWARDRRSRFMTIAAAIALPFGYEVFRMGYYGLLVPNTAVAKEASEAWWSQGLRYAVGFVRDTHLMPPLLVAFVALAWVFRRLWLLQERRLLAVASVFCGVAFVHTIYIVRLGGDWMFGRMLLPPLFSLLLPIAVVPARRLFVGAAVLTALWATAFTARSGPYDDVRLVFDVRAEQNPSGEITVKESTWSGTAEWGRRLARIDQKGEHHWVVYPSPYHIPTVEIDAVLPSGPTIGSISGIGWAGLAADVDTYIDDTLGLSNPIGSHIRNEYRGAMSRLSPGHEKQLPLAWTAARFVPPDVPLDPMINEAVVRDARAALRCGDIKAILDATTAPLTLKRFFVNILSAPRLTSARFDAPPGLARPDQCGDDDTAEFGADHADNISER